MTKDDVKAVQKYIESKMTLIAEGRSKVMDAGGEPRVIYISDILPREKGKYRSLPMKLDTGCTVFGMNIIIDYRVPFDNCYITQGIL